MPSIRIPQVLTFPFETILLDRQLIPHVTTNDDSDVIYHFDRNVDIQRLIAEAAQEAGAMYGELVAGINNIAAHACP